MINGHGFIFSFTVDLTQNEVKMMSGVPNPMFWWNRSLVDMLPEKIPSVFKIKLINVKSQNPFTKIKKSQNPFTKFFTKIF